MQNNIFRSLSLLTVSAIALSLPSSAHAEMVYSFNDSNNVELGTLTLINLPASSLADVGTFELTAAGEAIFPTVTSGPFSFDSTNLGPFGSFGTLSLVDDGASGLETNLFSSASLRLSLAGGETFSVGIAPAGGGSDALILFDSSFRRDFQRRTGSFQVNACSGSGTIINDAFFGRNRLCILPSAALSRQ